jgi:aminoglycoside phosphotransferase family enzyme
VHLGVWSLSNVNPCQLLCEESDGEPVVAMARLPGELQLAAVFSNPSTADDRIDEVAAACANFHARCPVDRRPDGYGAIANTIHSWTINFEQLPLTDATIPLSSAEREQLITETDDWLESIRPTLTQRIAEGRIREGHGDLRLEHIYLTRPWSVIDPLEFSIELRFCDVAAEVCFLGMELDDIGRPETANRLVLKYAEAAEDLTMSTVAPIFKRYRAVVRAKVEWIRASQTVGADQNHHLEAARRLFELALSYRTQPLR